MKGLNPCYSGICSVRVDLLVNMMRSFQGLNPCYSGICSVRSPVKKPLDWIEVLILVIVEYAL